MITLNETIIVTNISYGNYDNHERFATPIVIFVSIANQLIIIILTNKKWKDAPQCGPPRVSSNIVESDKADRGPGSIVRNHHERVTIRLGREKNFPVRREGRREQKRAGKVGVWGVAPHWPSTAPCYWPGRQRSKGKWREAEREGRREGGRGRGKEE